MSKTYKRDTNNSLTGAFGTSVSSVVAKITDDKLGSSEVTTQCISVHHMGLQNNTDSHNSLLLFDAIQVVKTVKNKVTKLIKSASHYFSDNPYHVVNTLV